MWAYVAGFFDGEGSISISGSQVRSPRFVIQIAQKSRIVLDKIQTFLSTRGINSRVYARTDAAHVNGMHNLYIGTADDVLKFLRNVRPYVIVKKQTAEDAMRLSILYPSLRPKGKRF